MKKIKLEEFHALLKAQGVPHEHYAFRCPVCKTIQSATDLIQAGAGKTFDEIEGFLGFSCFGRWTKAGSHKKDTPPGRGCNWTLGGLFQFHELEVQTDDGESHPRFEPVTPEEAQAHMREMESRVNTFTGENKPAPVPPTPNPPPSGTRATGGA